MMVCFNLAIELQSPTPGLKKKFIKLIEPISLQPAFEKEIVPNKY